MTKTNEQENNQTPKQPESNVYSIVDYTTVRNRVNTVAMVFPKEKLLETFNILLDGIASLTDREYEDIAMLLRTKMLEDGKLVPTPKTIEGKLRAYLTRDGDWDGYNFVGEENGGMYILTGAKNQNKEFVSNFTLTPKHTITVQGQGGKKYHMYDVKIKGDNKIYTVKLTARDFDKMESLQDALSKQLSNTSALISGSPGLMRNLGHKYINLAEFEFNMDGTSLLGLERFENDGPKYFCSPDGIYGLDGKASTDIIFMGNEQSNEDELKNLTNLSYDEHKWKNEIAPVFLRNFIHINDKTAMMSLMGWMGSVPHDYVIRKEANTGFMPHCHIVGEPGSGKSTLMTLAKQYMGHNDSAPRAFPTAFEVSKLLNSSYTIPVVLDEYGKRWSQNQTDSMNKVLVESFTRSRWSRGQANLSSVYFKYKNPVLMGGQIPTSDQALAARIVPITIYKAYQNTAAGKKSFKHLTALQKMNDKNFWVGYNLWCAQFSNEDVEAMYSYYRNHCRSIIDENRSADIYAVVMLGLHYMKKLAFELDVTEKELGYTDQDILDMAQKLDNTADTSDNKDTPLAQFLRGLAQYAISRGNGNNGNYFGKGLAVMEYTPTNSAPGQYGGRNKKEVACIYGKELILIKVENMIEVLNNSRKNDYFNEKEVMTFINAEFMKSMQDPLNPENLVLAPKQYELKSGKYTAFSKAELLNLHGEFDVILWKN